MNVQTIAAQALAFFETRTRPRNGHAIVLKSGTPDWVRHLVRAAHGDSLPDDWTYFFVKESLELLVEYADSDDARDAIEPDVYNNALLAWLGSDQTRVTYLESAVRDGMVDTDNFDLYEAARIGQSMEREVVFENVLDSLEQHLEETEEPLEGY